MKIILSAALVIVCSSLTAQTYSDRFEATKYPIHLTSEFGLKGAVEHVISQRFSLVGKNKWEADPYETQNVLGFDKSGYLQFTHLINAEGDTTESSYYSYDANKKLTEVKEVHRGQRGTFSTMHLFTYTEQGKLAKIERGGRTKYERIYTYDELGRLLTDQLLANGKQEFMDEYHYVGTTEKIDYVKNKQVDTFDFSATDKYGYDKKGKLKSIDHILDNPAYHFRNYEQRLDAQGNIVETIGGDSLVISEHYDHRYKAYNKKGDLIRSKLYVRTPGEGDVTGAIEITLTYDTHDNWIERKETSKYIYSLEGEEPNVSAERVTREITYFN